MSAVVATLNESDADKIEALLLGRRIVSAETGTFKVPGRSWGSASGRLALDDGTQVLVVPNVGGCSCGAGDYDLTHLAGVDNVITAVRLVEETLPGEDEWESLTAYRIFVLADAVEINAMTVEGDDGNGYYGTGYELVVVAAEAAS